MGLFEGTATNLGSVLGTMSGVEVLLSDGSSATNFATHMNSVIGRAAVFNAGTIASNFFASSEGNTAVPSILSINPNSSVGWQIGLDLAGIGYAGSGTLFTTGIALRLPNNDSISSVNAAGSGDVDIVFVDGSNNVRFAFGGAPSIFGGSVSSTALIAGGSVPTLSGTCSAGAQVGGNTADTFKASAACSAGTVILTFATTAPNGWVCGAHDMTTPANSMNQTASSTTTCTLTGTMASADVVAFDARAF
jgi:hypothetical protein